jgi:hypothetical protein
METKFTFTNGLAHHLSIFSNYSKQRTAFDRLEPIGTGLEQKILSSRKHERWKARK